MTYYFDALPTHPPPEPLESFTSYLTRLAELNAIESLSSLARVCLPNQNPKAFRTQKDYPPSSSFETMQHVSVCSEDVLQQTTFQYVGNNLGRSTGPKTGYPFLARSVARFLRYCPLCLIEQSYYRLPWRFIQLNGCYKHKCQILSICGHCQNSIPIFSPLLKIGLCPRCEKDLRECHSKALVTESEIRECLDTQNLLEFLLSPQSWRSTCLSRSIALGRKFSASREQKQITLAEASQHIGFSVRSLQFVEQGESGSNRGASLDIYCSYARYLDVNLLNWCHEILMCDVEQGKEIRGKAAYDEESVAKRVIEAITLLKSQGKRVTQKNVSSVVEIHTKLLYEYPRVKEIMQKCVDNLEEEQRKLSHTNEDKLYERVVVAINQLEREGKPISYSTVGRVLGSHSRTFHKYPRIKALLQQKANYYQKQFEKTILREEELLAKAANAVQQLEQNKQLVTAAAIKKMIGLTESRLGRFPRLRKLLEEYSPRQAQMMKMYVKQEEMLPKVHIAIQSLKELGLPITRSAIARSVGISPSNLDAYPEILSTIREIFGTVWKGYEREQLEEDVVVQVEAALRRLKEQGKPLTKQAISEESGVGLSRLEGYPGVNVVVERTIAEYWRIHRRERNENIHLFNAQEALKRLKEEGRILTREAIAQSIGLSAHNLNYYPRVVAYIREVCEEARKNALEIRFQLREETLACNVLSAIQLLYSRKEPITKKAISRIIGISVPALRYYPRVKSIMDDAVKSYRVTKYKHI